MSNHPGKRGTKIGQETRSPSGASERQPEKVRSADRDGYLPKAFPAGGQSWQALQSRMEEMRSADFEWQRGRLPLHVYFAGHDVAQVAREAYAMFMTENALAPAAFPSVDRMQREILDAALELFHGPTDACGTFTSGGSESIILAVKAARDWARSRRVAEGLRGEILLPATAHPAFDKAADLMDLNAVRVGIGDDFRPMLPRWRRR